MGSLRVRVPASTGEIRGSYPIGSAGCRVLCYGYFALIAGIGWFEMLPGETLCSPDAVFRQTPCFRM